MTCIIGLEENGKAYIGGDSSVISGWERQILDQYKVFYTCGYTIGYTTSFRMGQLLRYKVKYPSVPENVTEEFMVNVFIESIRSTLKDYGFSKIESNVETGGVFLVGLKNTIWQVWDDFQVLRFHPGIYSVGIGSSYALASMNALQDYLEPKDRILKSLEITKSLCSGVIAPFYVKQVL